MPDLFRAFAWLPEHERTVVLAWADVLGCEPEAIPPLRALIEAVSVARLAEGFDGPTEARWQEAAASLGMDPTAGDSARRKCNFWRARARSGKNRPDFRTPGREVVETR